MHFDGTYYTINDVITVAPWEPIEISSTGEWTPVDKKPLSDLKHRKNGLAILPVIQV